ncbi:MAG: hypothetical protein H6621_05180 [Halobacteriovoraceae bacterium]|nr:hypothetical protein [Halobacteriovoraceae bacterium]
MKLFLLILFFYSLSFSTYSESKKLNVLKLNIPYEWILLTNSLLSHDIEKIEENIKKTNEYLKYLEKRESLYIIKSTIYKDLFKYRNLQKIFDLKKSLKNINDLNENLKIIDPVKSQFDDFSSWIFQSIKKDIESYPRLKERNKKDVIKYTSPWILILLQYNNPQSQKLIYDYYNRVFLNINNTLALYPEFSKKLHDENSVTVLNDSSEKSDSSDSQNNIIEEKLNDLFEEKE